MTDLENTIPESGASSQTPLRDRFFRGIRDSDLDAVRAALAEDRTLVMAFDPDHFEANPVTVAVHHGNLELVDLLLEHGADINRKSDWWAGGFAPIHSIPRHHRARLLPALVERGAVVDVHAAAQHGDVDRLKELIDEDARRVLERGGDGQHPLHSVVSGKPHMVEFLLSRGATAQRWHTEDAEYGIGGGFNEYTGATADDFRTIVEMLETTSS